MQFIGGYDFYTGYKPDISVEAYFRLLIPDLFSQYEKIIYFDGDMICCIDVADLFNTDIDKYLLAAVKDYGAIRDYYRRKKRQPFDDFGISLLKNPDAYFNSGMLIFNIKKISETITTKKMLDFAVSRDWKMHDQDVLNVLCEGKVLLLPLNWNFIYPNSSFGNDSYRDFLPSYLLEEYLEAKDVPFIVHLAGASRKPWETWGNIPYFEKFWKYATRTPFIDTIMKRMTEKGLAGLSGLDYIRLKIQNGKLRDIKFIIKCLLNKHHKNEEYC
jgi:lipopolysaccharide biosynthesis glycosyltransferase